MEHVPWLGRYLRRREREVEALLPLDAYGLEQYTAAECLKDVVVYGMVLAGQLLLIGGLTTGQWEYLLAAGVAAVTVVRHRIFRWKRQREEQLLSQMTEYLDDLRYAYYRSQDVEEAIYEAWTRAGEEWKLHLAMMEPVFFRDEIPGIYRREPSLSHMISFLATCQSALRFGGETETRSLFLDNLEEIQGNIQMDLLKREREREMFFFALPGVLLAVFSLPIIESWSVVQIPELVEFYQGELAGALRLLIALVFYLVDRLLCYLRMGDPERGVGGKEGKRTKAERWEKRWYRLEGRMGRWTAEIYRTVLPMGRLADFYGKRLWCVAVVLLLGLVWCLCYRVSVSGWLFCLLLALLASFLPYLELTLLARFYLSDREDEVSRFRTVLYLLSGVPQMTAELVLEYLIRFGYYYRAELLEYLDHYGEELPEREADPAGFYRILEDVEAVDRVGIREAFRDIVSKREFWRAKNRQRMEMELRKKETYIQMVLFLPVGVAVTVYLILPFLQEGMKSLMSITEMGV